MVTFMAYDPWDIQEQGKKAAAGKLTIHAQSSLPDVFETEESLHDSQGREVHILRILCSPAISQEVSTVITWKK